MIFSLKPYASRARRNGARKRYGSVYVRPWESRDLNGKNNRTEKKQTKAKRFSGSAAGRCEGGKSGGRSGGGGGRWCCPTFGAALSAGLVSGCYRFSARHNENLFQSQSNPLIYRGEKFDRGGTIAAPPHHRPRPARTRRQLPFGRPRVLLPLPGLWAGGAVYPAAHMRRVAAPAGADGLPPPLVRPSRDGHGSQ